VAGGALLGAVLGARHGLGKLPKRWVEGLVGEKGIRKEVNVFVDLVVKTARGGGEEGCVRRNRRRRERGMKYKENTIDQNRYF